MATIREESDYDSSRSSLTAPRSRRSWISDIGSSSSVSVRSFGRGWDTPAASCRHKPHKANQAEWEAIRRVRATAGRVGLEHFRLVRRLGSGDLGNVYLCQLRDPWSTGCLYAMKVVDKDALAFRKKLRRAEVEREILRTLDHPFLPTLYADFEASHYACLVMEFCPGGDLHVARQRQPCRRFSISSARFYVAETVLALEYLHLMGVVYRDLKPENVLVRGDGHIMLSDFDLSLKCDVVPRLLRHNSLLHNVSAAGGWRADAGKPSCVPPIQPVLSCLFNGVHKCQAKEGAPAKPGHDGREADSTDDRTSEPCDSNPELVVEPVSARSKSFVGTHEYLAPEVISGQGHGSAVDWWTLGVFMYEMIYGRTPFKGENNEKTLVNIIKQPLAFPRVAAASGREWDEHLRAQDLMTQLLAKNPKKRLGGCTGSAEVKRHDFFKGVNWALVRSVRPPEVPKPLVVPAPAPAQKKVLMMSRKERQEPYNYNPRSDERFEYF
ncbi:protein kinase PINOID 2-like isoform X3 [Miscanthus floridulus]|uniref:protein kinase PINOID 2-like isoform X3 n=1 Tax=Miscanthus floridulus TaxID=154761 RepID=UPI003457F2DE